MVYVANSNIVMFNEEQIQKHMAGKHDQSTHGHGGAGKTSVSNKITRGILDKVKENGGLSVRLTNGSEPIKGFMVSRKGMGAIENAKDFYDPTKGKKILSDYMKKHKNELSTGEDYLGVWHEGDKVYLDVSANIMDRETAVVMGQENDQISIWDVVNFDTIATGGTGNV
jgi:GTPase SAR1 family protein